MVNPSHTMLSHLEIAVMVQVHLVFNEINIKDLFLLQFLNAYKLP